MVVPSSYSRKEIREALPSGFVPVPKKVAKRLARKAPRYGVLHDNGLQAVPDKMSGTPNAMMIIRARTPGFHPINRLTLRIKAADTIRMKENIKRQSRIRAGKAV